MFFIESKDYRFAMTFYKFEDITSEHQFLGGKAYALGLMSNAHFPVPLGAVCSSMPESISEWDEIFKWWESIGSPKLAIRSSAQGEDSGDQSFAGQNSTFLNIDEVGKIKISILKCFESFNKKSSSLYREHFLKEKSSQVKMNVVLQEMVAPLYSGVFFSTDPRQINSSWVCEAIEGYGEDLVSGKKTPYHFTKDNQSSCTLFNIQDVIDTGIAVQKYFGHEIDMEWAIDKNHSFKVLQARPITALSGKTQEKKLIQQEIERLKTSHPADTLWDGQTFAEWSGPPTELTFSLWQKAFSKGHAFSKSLQNLGYLGIDQELSNETHSLLEKILGRGYVNISLMAPLYFGSIPFKMAQFPKPHLKFDYRRMTFSNFIQTPFTIWKMIKIGWKLSTERREILNDCKAKLIKMNPNLVSDNYSHKSFEELIELLKSKTHLFSSETLVAPLMLIVLVESTNQSLRSLLKGLLSPDEIESKLKLWMAHGIHTASMKMNEDYQEASLDQSKRPAFYQHYGHRGPGELELSHLRWSELGDKIFYDLKNKKSSKHEDFDVSTDILALNSYKKLAILKEWELLKDMLELREAWKMALLRPYFEIRQLVLKISEKKNLHDLIFWFSLDEILENSFNQELAIKRLEEAKVLKSISLPSIVSLFELKNIYENNGKSTFEKNQSIQGTPISSGIAFGEVRVVSDPDLVNTDDWPQNVVLVAESTDPGWTGLFLKSSAIIVEKGGVLSHCAIVAREMNLPAVSEVKQCHLRYKDGDQIWVDGNNGRISTFHES